MRKPVPARSPERISCYSAVRARHRVRVREEERRKIAHELHDAFGQDLVTVVLEMNRLELYCKAEAYNPISVKISNALENLSDRVSKIAASISDVSHRLHPIVLERAGLHCAIRELCKHVDSTSSTRVRFSGRELQSELPRATSLCLYRVTQEALHNVERHARAVDAEVTLEMQGQSIVLTVRDNGVGYDPNQLGTRAGLGIVDMQEHVASLAGMFDVKTAPNEGTEVRVRLPFQ